MPDLPSAADLDRAAMWPGFQQRDFLKTGLTLARGRPRLSWKWAGPTSPRFDLSCGPAIRRRAGGSPGCGRSARRWPVSRPLEAQRRQKRRVLVFQPLRASLASGERLRLSRWLVPPGPDAQFISGNPDQLPGPVGPAHRVIHPSVMLPRRSLLGCSLSDRAKLG